MRPSIIVILASALMGVGVFLAGGVVVRLCQESQCLSQPEVVPPATPVPVVAIVGGRSLSPPTSTDGPIVGPSGGSDSATSGGSDPANPSASDPAITCPWTPADGLPVDTMVQAIGILRLYPEPDTLSVALADHNAGDQFGVVADASGATAITSCAVLWYRVRNAAAVEGWVLEAAVERLPPPVTPVPTSSPCQAPACVACGCGQQQSGCGQPCGSGQQCYPSCGSPCNNQPPNPCDNPCQSPCGGYQGYDPGYSTDPYPSCGGSTCGWTSQ